MYVYEHNELHPEETKKEFLNLVSVVVQLKVGHIVPGDLIFEGSTAAR
jgi:hypothetical protein